MKKNQEVVDKPRKEKRTKHLLPWFILTSLVSVIVGLVAGWFIHISMVDAVRSDAIKTVKELSSWRRTNSVQALQSEIKSNIVKDTTLTIKSPPRALESPTDNLCTLTHKYDWDKSVAYAVCMAESHGNPKAFGDGHTDYPSIGLMQIRTLPGRPSKETLEDPEYNVQYAYNMWKGQGFRPWSAYTNGAYQKYIQ